MTLYQISKALDNVSIDMLGLKQRWEITSTDTGFLLQLAFQIPDNDTGELSTQKGGKIYISKHAVHSEVILKAWQLYQSFWIHEMREMFTYKGVRIFNPHVDIEMLYEFMSTEPIEKR